MKKIFLKILWKSRKDYLLIIFSGIFIVSTIFFSAAVGSCLLYVSSGAVADMTPLIGSVEEGFLLPYIFLIILMVLLLFSYIKKRAADYGMLSIMGIKKKHYYMFVAGEYLGIIVFSVGGGILAGYAEAVIVRGILERIFADIIDGRIYLGWSPLRLTVIIALIIFGFGFVICDQTIACLGVDSVVAMGKRGGLIRKSPVLLIVGVLLIVVSFSTNVTYWGKIGSGVPLVLLVLGIVLILFFGGGMWLLGLKNKKKKYYKKILRLNDWYERFYYHMNMTAVVAGMLVIILFNFMIALLDNLPVSQPENYPHDLVWGANSEDQDFLDNLKDKYGVKIETIPSFRVATADFGEHTGISASEYERITGKHLELENGQIFVVYQRDREEMGTCGLDFDNVKPRMYIGNSDYDLWVFSGLRILPGNQLVRKYEIKDSENRIITGNFKTRSLKMKCDVFENIIVFSDEEFEKLRQNARGANLTVIMKIPKDYQKVVDEVYAYAKEHSQVNYYDWREGNLIYEKRQQSIETRQNKMINVSAMLINIITLAVCIIFVLLEKAISDYDDMSWKYRFYECEGMTRKKRKCNVYQETWMTAKIAMMSAIPLTLLLTGEKIWNKQLPKEWNIRYITRTGGMAFIIIAMICIVMRLVARRIFVKMERRNKR